MFVKGSMARDADLAPQGGVVVHKLEESHHICLCGQVGALTWQEIGLAYTHL